MDKLYIPNAKKWVRFYEKLVSGQINPHQSNVRHTFQVGGNLGGRYFGSSMIPIDSYIPRDHTENPSEAKITMISPAEQVVEQAKAELKRENTNRIKTQRISKKGSIKKNTSGGKTSRPKSKKGKSKSNTNIVKTLM